MVVDKKDFISRLRQQGTAACRCFRRKFDFCGFEESYQPKREGTVLAGNKAVDAVAMETGLQTARTAVR